MNAVYCRAGLTPNQFGNYVLWVESPRTGRRINIGEGWLNDLPNGKRIRTRVVQAMSQYRPAAFTSDELKALVALEAKIAEKNRPQPPGPDRRRGWGSR